MIVGAGLAHRGDRPLDPPARGHQGYAVHADGSDEHGFDRVAYARRPLRDRGGQTDRQYRAGGQRAFLLSRGGGEREEEEGPHQPTSGWITSPEGTLGWKNVLLAGMDSPASETSTIWRTGVARSSTASRQDPWATASSASAREWT